MNTKKLINKSKFYRLQILNKIFDAKKGHIGGSLSIIDFLTVLYQGGFVDHKKKSEVNLFKDNTCLLSKGHCAIAQYVILNDLKFISNKQLKNFNLNGAKIAEHPDLHIRGIGLTSGSLGHVLSQAMGIAYQRYLQKNKNKIYVVLGDGELSEGSIWESLLSLKDFSFLSNLVIVIDHNKFMTLKKVEYVDFNLINSFFKSLNNINVEDCDGHDFIKINLKLQKFKRNKKLNILFLKTVKGKGISFMENNPIWHHKVPNEKEFKLAYYELNN